MSHTVHIAEGFVDAWIDLNERELKQVKKAVKQIKEDPSFPALRRHKLVRVPNDRVWSYSPNSELRIISYEPTPSEIYLLYLNHHDIAYRWAQTRKVFQEGRQLNIELVRTTEREEDTRGPEEELPQKGSPFADIFPQRNPGTTYMFDPHTDDELLQVGVPESYLEVIRRLRNEDDFMLLVDHIPGSIAEILMELAYKAIEPEKQVDAEEQAPKIKTQWTYSSFADAE